MRKPITSRHGKTGESGQNRSRVESGHGLSRVASQVKLTRIFQTNFFFFFEVDAICQLFMSSLIVIRFLLVILLLITTKQLT